LLSIFKLAPNGTDVIPWDAEDFKTINEVYGLGKKRQEPTKSFALENKKPKAMTLNQIVS
jgi:hypothetical protein